MNDKNKTKDQLIGELAELRQRVADLEATEAAWGHSEEALRESKGHLQLAIDAARIAVWNWNVRENYTVWSDNAEEVLGFRHGSFGNNFEAYMKWVHPEDIEPINDRVSRALEEKQVEYRSEYRLIRPNGEIRWISAPGQVFYDSSGAPIRIAGIMMDITERVQAEQALRESEERFRRAIVDAPIPIMIHAEDEEVLHISDIWTELTGFAHNDIPTIADWTLKAYGQRMENVRSIIDAAFERNAVAHDGEFKVKTKSGETRIWDFSSGPIGQLPDGRRMIISMAMDITKHKRAEEALAEKTHMLGERVKELNCLYGMSKLLEIPGISLEEIFQETVDFIPLSWQYPEVTCARLTLEGQEFSTRNFKKTIWTQSSGIVVRGDHIGTIEIYYLEERPERDDGPFVKEERDLLNAITEQMGRFIERLRADEELRLQGEITTNMSEGVCLVRASDLVIVYANPRFEKMFGYDQGEMVGKHVSIVNAPSEKSPLETAGEIMEFIEKEGSWRGEVNNIKKDGTPFWCNASVTVFDHSEHGSVLVAVHTDITERKAAEEELANSELMLQNSQRIGRIGSFEMDIKTGEVKWSDQLFDLFGLKRTRGPIDYDKVLELIHPDDRKRAIKVSSEAAQKREPYELEHRVIHPEGNVFDLLIQGDVVHNDKNEVIKIAGTVQDITERKAAEEELRKYRDNLEELVEKRTTELSESIEQLQREAIERVRAENELQESEKKFRTLVATAPDGIVLLDTQGTILESNERFSQTFGYEQDDMLGKSFLEFIPHREGQFRAEVMFQNLLEAGSIPPQEIQITTGMGQQVLVEMYVATMRNDNDEIINFIVGFRDLSERVKAKEALRKSEVRFKELADSITDIFYAMDKDLRYIYWNRASEELTGISAKDALGKSLYELFPDIKGTEAEKMFLGVLFSQQPQCFMQEYQLEGKKSFFEISAYPSGSGLSVFTKDITERKMAEDQLQRYAAELESANLELSQYAYVVSHDLKAPLRAIHNYTDFLLEDLEPVLDGDQKSYLDGLTDAVLEAEELVVDLLELSYIGREAPSTEAVDTGVFLQSLVPSLDIPPEVDILMGEDWPTIEVEPSMLRQIFQNLIDNAVKFNTSPVKRVELGWKSIPPDPTGSRKPVRSYEFFVRDNGIGIDPRYHEQIFGVFERLHTRDEYPGTGIGLAIVKKAANKLGGTVRLESTLGEGSTFFVTLPEVKE